MKKIVALLSVGLLAIIGVSPAQANSQGSIAIIDVNFESHLIDGPVTEICITSQVICNMSVVPRNASQFKAFNHGTIMADVARSANPSAHLILLEAGSTKTGVITGNQLLAALNWVVANASQQNIKAVSFSYNAGNGSRCTPSAPGANISLVHNSIVSAIANLKVSGIKFYASTGNHASKSQIDYPACISDSVAVGSTQFAGSVPLSDLVLSGGTYSSSKLKSSRTAIQGGHDSFAVTLTDTNPLLVGFTTSVATVIAAATNK